MRSVPAAAERVLAHVLSAVRLDSRVAGLLAGGSLSDGRADVYSDLDLALFIRDADLASFESDWVDWASRFGRLLLAYVGGVGHPWAVYDAEPIPLRVDFSLWPASGVEVIADWPISPTSVGAMVLHDATGGEITRKVEAIVGQSLAPREPALAFEAACGDFWYYSLRVIGKLERADRWGAYWELQAILVSNLLALLRLESGATERWRGAAPALGASQSLETARLAELEAALPRSTEAPELRRALLALAEQAERVCRVLAAREGCGWPTELAEKVVRLLGGSAR